MSDVPAAKEVTTMGNEIARHRQLADIFTQLAALSNDALMFTASSVAATHQQTAERLEQLRETSR